MDEEARLQNYPCNHVKVVSENMRFKKQIFYWDIDAHSRPDNMVYLD